MAKVFVSHASEDHLVAAELYQWLIGDGHEVFLDQDLRDGIALGEEWEQRLLRAAALGRRCGVLGNRLLPALCLVRSRGGCRPLKGQSVAAAEGRARRSAPAL